MSPRPRTVRLLLLNAVPPHVRCIIIYMYVIHICLVISLVADVVADEGRQAGRCVVCSRGM